MSRSRDAQYIRGCHDSRGGDTMSTSGVFRVSKGYGGSCEGYHEYILIECSLH